jgi:hypothetical protein
MPSPYPPRGPGDFLALRDAAWSASRRVHQSATLASLRAAFKEGERILTGWDAIIGFVHEHGVRSAFGQRVTAPVLRSWRRRLGFPLLPGRWKNTPPASSTYLILAWLVNLPRSGVPGGVRIAKMATSAATSSASEPQSEPQSEASC